MAKKSDKGEPVGWVTVKGKHFPKWKDGTIGWQDGEESEPNRKAETTKSRKEDAIRHIMKTENVGESVAKDTYDHMSESEKKHVANEAHKSKTSRNADDIYNERKNIKGNTQEEATRREKLSEELSRTVVSGMKSGEVYKVPSGKGYEELRYVGSEMKNNRAYATFETPNKSRTGIVKEGSDLYGIQSMKSSQPATTSRNAKYDTSRSNDSYFSMRHAAEEDTSRNSRGVTSLLKSKGFTKADAIAAYASLHFTNKQSAAENIRLMSPEEVLALVQQYKRKRK